MHTKSLLILLLLPFCLSAQVPELDSIYWHLDLEDVVVTAQYAPTDSRSAVHDIRVLKQARIRQLGANNLEDLLRQELNVRITQDLILGSSMSLQGIGGQNVKILIDGIAVIGRVGDNIDLSQINLQQIEKVELVEGPMSVYYGTDALGGVVNLITKKSQVKKIEAGLTSQWESVGWKNWNANAGLRLHPKVLLQMNWGNNNFDGLRSDTTRAMQWNPKVQQFVNTALRYNWGADNRLRYTVNWFDERVEDRGILRRPQFQPYAFDDFYSTRRWSHALQHEGSCGEKWYLKSSLGYNTFERIKSSYRYDAQTDHSQRTNNGQDTIRFAAQTVRVVLATNRHDSKLNFQTGLDLRREIARGTRLESEHNRGTAEIGDYALFGSLKYQPLSELTLQAGTRLAYNTRFDVPLAPSFHALWNIAAPLTFRLSYARGFRSPNLKELFFYFVDVNHFILGNPDLQAEQSNNYQLSLNYEKQLKGNQLQLTLAGYYNDIRNKIDLYSYGEDNGKLQYAYFNRDHFRTLGLNLRAAFQIKNLTVAAGVAPTGRYNILSETSREIAPYTFATELNGEVKWSLPKYKLTVATFLRYNDKLVRFYSEFNAEGADPIRERIEDGFAIADLSVSRSFWKKQIQLTSGIKNLLDVRNITTSGSNRAASPHGGSADSKPVSIGRSYFVRLNLHFGR